MERRALVSNAKDLSRTNANRFITDFRGRTGGMYLAEGDVPAGTQRPSESGEDTPGL